MFIVTSCLISFCLFVVRHVFVAGVAAAMIFNLLRSFFFLSSCSSPPVLWGDNPSQSQTQIHTLSPSLPSFLF